MDGSPWCHSYALNAPHVRDEDEFVHVHAHIDPGFIKEKTHSPRPPHHPPPSHFHTYGGRLRSASGTDMDHDDGHQPKLGRMSSLHGWRSSVRRSVAHFTTRGEGKADTKHEKHMSRHGSSPGYLRSGAPLTAPSAYSLHAPKRAPLVTRSYSSGNNSLLDQPSPVAPPLCHSPSSAMSTVSSDASDFADLFTTTRSVRESIRERASKSTNNLSETLLRFERLPTKAKREVFTGLQATPFTVPITSRFVTPTIDQVLPYSSSPFAAWDPAAAGVLGQNQTHKGSLASTATSGSSWYEPSRRRGAPGARRTCRTEDGKEIRSVYPVGWERAVLDLEGRLHETMYEVAGGVHTFVDADDDEAPATVLDLGTGTGLWALSQALAWPKTRFVAADLVPCHADLEALADAEDQARTSSSGTAPGKGQWRNAADRIDFQQYDFLKSLPYDSGVLDMVHMRFLGLGIPEHRWGDLLDEAIRVLKPGGVLEIVEMSIEAPPSTSPRVHKAYSQLLMDNYIAPNPVFALQLALPATAGIVPASSRPVFSANWEIGGSTVGTTTAVVPSEGGAPPDAIADAAMTWIRSALDYKDVQGSDEGERAMRALVAANPYRWGATQGSDKYCETPKTPSTPGMPITPSMHKPPAFDVPSTGKVSLAAWVVVKATAS